jgi:hypothetical protein
MYTTVLQQSAGRGDGWIVGGMVQRGAEYIRMHRLAKRQVGSDI